MRYRVDASRSRFIAQAFAKGLLSAFGHNPRLAIRSFEGEAEFDPAAPNAASVWMTARADSLVVIGDMSEEDRHEIERVTREELLEAARYPEVVFRSAGVSARQVAEGRYQASGAGDLSLHGVTRELAIDVAALVEGDELRAQGGFELRLTDFNIRPISVAGGLLKLKDEVKLSFDILAHASSE
ncbi:MAG TPA: YceI family protein [Blastocatellia bacterium]|nr:YceI family protein [Blastocatellia bacterium]